MIGRIISRWASRILSSQRKDPRDKIRETTRKMCADMGIPVPEGLPK